MKALSVKNPYAAWIADGSKTIELRTWRTNQRGDILIVSSAHPEYVGMPGGVALCVIELYDCRQMTANDCEAALSGNEWYSDAWCFCLRNVRLISPQFHVKGRLGFYDVRLPSGVYIGQNVSQMSGSCRDMALDPCYNGSKSRTERKMTMFHSFTVKTKDGNIEFYTLDGWRGLWSPLSLVGDQYESEGQLPGFTQSTGTCDVVGESAVRRAAREMVATYVY